MFFVSLLSVRLYWSLDVFRTIEGLGEVPLEGMRVCRRGHWGGTEEGGVQNVGWEIGAPSPSAGLPGLAWAVAS